MMTYLKVYCMLTGIISSYGYVFIYVDDLSGNKTATQISTFPCGRCTDVSYSAGMAVDNNFTTCTRNENPDGTEWWMVDLQEIQSIYAIKFVFKEYVETYRKRQQERLSGYSIYVSKSAEIKSGELCFNHNRTNLPSLTAEHICPSFGRYVQFVNDKQYIELCDFLVLGCQRGHYSVNCNLLCPKHCKSNQCFATNGTCLGCESGWTGFACNQACSVGMYGPDCSLSCSWHCKNNSPCNPIDGICSDGCADGWMGLFCNKSCSPGKFGPDCKNNCSKNCLNDSICNHRTGECNKGCKPGYQGELCNKVCRHGYFGRNCSRLCGSFCIKNCQNINGLCLSGCINGYKGPTCEQKCSNGWYGHNCSMRCDNCVNQTCNHVTGSCQYGCKPGWSGSICSVVCTADKYGADCMSSCSQNCINKESCDHRTGVCENGCSDGYKGELCNLICGNGYFGANCSNVCSENCSDICHHVDGTCNCKAGMMDSPECKQVSSLTTTKKCDDHWLYAIGMSILIILNVLTCVLWICGRRRQMKGKRQSSSHYITTEAEMKEKTYESHEYQEVNSVSRDFSYQNLSFDT